eukprot:sb/3465626/
MRVTSSFRGLANRKREYFITIISKLEHFYQWIMTNYEVSRAMTMRKKGGTRLLAANDLSAHTISFEETVQLNLKYQYFTGVTYILVYRTEKYKKLKASIEKQTKKLDKKKETVTDISRQPGHKKKIEKEEERLKSEKRDLSYVKMQSMIVIPLLVGSNRSPEPQKIIIINEEVGFSGHALLPMSRDKSKDTKMSSVLALVGVDEQEMCITVFSYMAIATLEIIHWCHFVQEKNTLAYFDCEYTRVQSDPDLPGPDLPEPRFTGRIIFPQTRKLTVFDPDILLPHTRRNVQRRTLCKNFRTTGIKVPEKSKISDPPFLLAHAVIPGTPIYRAKPFLPSIPVNRGPTVYVYPQNVSKPLQSGYSHITKKLLCPSPAYLIIQLSN